MKSPTQAASTDAARKPVLRLPAKTGEFAGDVSEMGEDFVEDDDSDGAVQAVSEGGDATQRVSDPAAAELVAADRSGRVRDRRATLVSPIPALLARQMVNVADAKAPAPAVQPIAVAEAGDGYTVELKPDEPQGILQQVEDRIAAARAFADARDFHSAARMAEDALAVAEAASDAAVDELIGTVRGEFDTIFASFVGPLNTTPVLVRTWEEILTRKLGDSTRSFLRRIDGVRTLEQILGHSSIPPQHALRITASAMRAGFIRIS